jgi:hypothetical protein
MLGVLAAFRKAQLAIAAKWCNVVYYPAPRKREGASGVQEARTGAKGRGPQNTSPRTLANAGYEPPICTIVLLSPVVRKNA